MAFLRNLQTNKQHYLHTHHNIGRRDKSVDTCIDSLDVSSIHAIIQWNNAAESWQIRDISLNGTWVDRHRLPSAENIKLKAGQMIQFGSPSSVEWCAEDLSAPSNLLIPLNSDSQLVTLSQYELLPNDHSPELAIFLSQHTDRWQLEYFDNNNTKPLTHGDHISHQNFEWQLFLIEDASPTVNRSTETVRLSEFDFIFDVSQDEENINLALKHNKREINLEHRTHHDLLLYLARQRYNDTNNGLATKSQGWVYNDQIARDLHLEGSHVNIIIFRARKLLSEKLPNVDGLEDLIQRRKGSMRIGCKNFKVLKCGKLECESTDKA